MVFDVPHHKATIMLTRLLARNAAVSCRTATVPTTTRSLSTIFTPSEEHGSLREMVNQFSEQEVEPQALEHNAKEIFNVPLFRKCGDLGLLGITVKEEYGGSGMDATAAVIVHEELSAVDPAFCLSYLAHSMIFVNNLHVNGSEEQKHEYLRLGACACPSSEPALT